MTNEQINDGGPAFPSGLESGHMAPLHNGMTLRDHCAYRYRYADAMLAARGPVAADAGGAE